MGLKATEDDMELLFKPHSINIPEGMKLDRQQMFALCFNRHMYKNMFRGCYPNNPDSFEETENKRRRAAIIFAVQNTNQWYYDQHNIKEW